METILPNVIKFGNSLKAVIGNNFQPKNILPSEIPIKIYSQKEIALYSALLEKLALNIA